MRTNNTLPLIASVIAALIWGLWWIPIRALETAGLPGPWPGIVMILATLPALGAVLIVTRTPLRLDMVSLCGALCIGMAITLYSTALTHTTIVRAVLLFYLAPGWSLAIECLTQGRRLKAINLAALLLALAGIFFAFRGDFGASGWRGGDVMALASGALWAIGAALVFSTRTAPIAALAFVSCAMAGLVGLFYAALTGTPAPVPTVLANSGHALIAGTLYVAPILLATLWGARRLGATTLTFILTGEIVAGVVSVAILENEPFGWPEILGTTLIICATLIEVIQPKGARYSAASTPRNPPD